MPVDISLRPLRPADEPLVFDAWIRCAWDHWRRQTERCPSCGGRFTYVGKDAFCDGMHARISRLLGGAQAITTPGKEESDYMIGFICRDPGLPVLHFLYVVEGWRSMGVATEVMRRVFNSPEVEVAYTQDSPAMPRMRKRWGCKFNPFLAEG